MSNTFTLQNSPRLSIKALPLTSAFKWLLLLIEKAKSFFKLLDKWFALFFVRMLAELTKTLRRRTLDFYQCLSFVHCEICHSFCWLLGRHFCWLSARCCRAVRTCSPWNSTKRRKFHGWESTYGAFNKQKFRRFVKSHRYNSRVRHSITGHR